jgi:hypothetical protein
LRNGGRNGSLEGGPRANVYFDIRQRFTVSLTYRLADFGLRGLPGTAALNEKVVWQLLQGYATA